MVNELKQNFPREDKPGAAKTSTSSRPASGCTASDGLRRPRIEFRNRVGGNRNHQNFRSQGAGPAWRWGDGDGSRIRDEGSLLDRDTRPCLKAAEMPPGFSKSFLATEMHRPDPGDGGKNQPNHDRPILFGGRLPRRSDREWKRGWRFKLKEKHRKKPNLISKKYGGDRRSGQT